MTLSLNEVEALARKAARGARYPWGLAEEAAMATRWLCARGVDGCGSLSALLSDCDGSDLADWAPMSNDRWQARSGILCPVTTGAALSDRAEVLITGDILAKKVARPVLLAAFAGLAAQQLKTTVALTWDRVSMVTDGDALCVAGETDAPFADVVVAAGASLGQPLPKSSRADPEHGVAKMLLTFAGRTYAPATEESRLKGAGSGLSDND